MYNSKKVHNNTHNVSNNSTKIKYNNLFFTQLVILWVEPWTLTDILIVSQKTRWKEIKTCHEMLSVQ